MNNNKILTVSYGTFSCTLEGFDDSFGTMKAIAEYFRDLAADDRYFGAEPPQPDAEMLARIAEREISRRVAAREQEGRIVLSADPAPDATLPIAAAAATAADEVAPAAAEEAPVNAPDTAAAPDIDLDAVAAASAEPDGVSEGVEAEVETAETAAPEPTEDATDHAADDDAHAAATADLHPATTEIAEPAAPLPAPALMDAFEPEADEIASFDAAPVTPDLDAVALETGSETTAPATAPNSIADKLQRIRAVVSASKQDTDEEAFFDDQHADAFPPAEDVAEVTFADTDASADSSDDAPAADDALLNDLVADLDAAAAEDAAADAEVEDDDADDIAAALARFDSDAADASSAPEAPPVDPDADQAMGDTEDSLAVSDSAEDELSADDSAEPVHQDHDADDDIAATLASLDTASTATASTADASGDDTDAVAQMHGEDSLAADLDRDMISDASEEDADNLFDTAEDSDALSEIAAEIDSETSADTDTAASMQVEAETEDEAEAEIADQEPASEPVSEDQPTLVAEADDTSEDDTPEADDTSETAETPRRARVIKVKRADVEAALAAGQLEEVADDSAPASSLSAEDEAELQAELDAVTAELPDAGADDAPAAPQDDTADAQATQHADAPTVPDADVSRLMAEADNQMEEPEGSRRRNAFQHLKAAVMAKKADAGLGQKKADEEGAFRSDLAEVVVPRRPSADGAPRVERPERQRAAPLKLVAEQRVDTDRPAAASVQPRRVVQEEVSLDADASGSFADYAADAGAHSLPELLEAAASYLSFVEGRAQFSRPQLMNTVRQMQPDEFSREDGLRSFGQLLRAGKIAKQQGGRFTVTEDIGYRPDERAAG
ncbi:MAG: hypothetical protein AAF601_12120 [Pseudomonadota bacterium]